MLKVKPKTFHEHSQLNPEIRLNIIANPNFYSNPQTQVGLLYYQFNDIRKGTDEIIYLFFISQASVLMDFGYCRTRTK